MSSGFAGLGTVSISQASFSVKPSRPLLSAQEASPPYVHFSLLPGACTFLSEPSTSPTLEEGNKFC